MKVTLYLLYFIHWKSLLRNDSCTVVRFSTATSSLLSSEFSLCRRVFHESSSKSFGGLLPSNTLWGNIRLATDGSVVLVTRRGPF